MSKTATNLTLEVVTIGYLRYLVDVGETRSLYSILDTLVLAYVEQYAEDNDLDMDDITKEAIRLYENSRRPQSAKSEEEQKLSAKRSLGRLSGKSKNSGMFDDDVNIGSLADDFK